MYECFHCGQRSVYWQNDFAFEDYGYEGEGIVHVCHCGNCGADIEYYVPYDNDDDNTNDNKEIEWKTTQKKNLNNGWARTIKSVWIYGRRNTDITMNHLMSGLIE